MEIGQFKIDIKPLSNLSRKVRLASQLQEKVKGVILGLAAGDRIGGPTKMATLLGESLVENSSFIANDVWGKYNSWWLTDGFDVGNVSEKVFNLVAQGMQQEAAVSAVDQELNGMTAGCNPVHRNMPIAMSVHLRDDDIARIAVQEASLTHRHHLASQVSATSVQLVRSLIRGADWFEAITKLENTSAPVICDALKDARKGKIHCDGYSLHVFSSAIHFVTANSNFDEMLEKAGAFSGEENYCAVLAGSFGGARWGASNIPNYWLAGIKELEKIRRLADTLANEW